MSGRESKALRLVAAVEMKTAYIKIVAGPAVACYAVSTFNASGLIVRKDMLSRFDTSNLAGGVRNLEYAESRH